MYKHVLALHILLSACVAHQKVPGVDDIERVIGTMEETWGDGDRDASAEAKSASDVAFARVRDDLSEIRILAEEHEKRMPGRQGE